MFFGFPGNEVGLLEGAAVHHRHVRDPGTHATISDIDGNVSFEFMGFQKVKALFQSLPIQTGKRAHRETKSSFNWGFATSFDEGRIAGGLSEQASCQLQNLNSFKLVFQIEYVVYRCDGTHPPTNDGGNASGHVGFLCIVFTNVFHD